MGRRTLDYLECVLYGLQSHIDLLLYLPRNTSWILFQREMKTEYSGIKDVVSYFTAMRDINPPIPWLANNLVNADKTSILILTFYNLNQFLQPTATFKFDAFIK